MTTQFTQSMKWYNGHNVNTMFDQGHLTDCRMILTQSIIWYYDHNVNTMWYQGHLIHFYDPQVYIAWSKVPSSKSTTATGQNCALI